MIYFEKILKIIIYIFYIIIFLETMIWYKILTVSVLSRYVCQSCMSGREICTSKAVAAAAVTAWVASATAQTTAVTAAAERLYAEARGMYAQDVHRGEGVCTYVCPAQKLYVDARGMYAQDVHRGEGFCNYVRSGRTP